MRQRERDLRSAGRPRVRVRARERALQRRGAAQGRRGERPPQCAPPGQVRPFAAARCCGASRPGRSSAQI